MSRTLCKSLMLTVLSATLGGCGLMQSVTEGTRSTARSIFYKQVNTLHLDFDGRAAMNTDMLDMSALSAPVLVRVYQLRDSRALERASYDRLLDDAYGVFGSDLLDERAVMVRPGQGAQLNVPMDKDARFVAAVALFRQPDVRASSWRLTLARDDLEPDRARVIELGDNQLLLRPLAKE
ncbi:type VI secretion system lipoprotein TssJ [Pseudomonas gingeri]|uniref:Type VI secretion system lipoprotein TssJ n=1 Tax=Pseudomonas gingeri TaxID=117681 RepID=A0A7Y7YF75_9PSED|nr:type VI secretion system lipoprotein TssJ [Pseudomonas gingeri]NWA02759.1 type VI secretion system lipoprotein TssJ [Pseudomonas gingeri]NWA12067.1 type VI secretion system lipoprotein TssJ [Pseudomonas gingeri]NWA57526.1 type VI secretion system lipoprotein TssJ [Pseudomonas gingeri]NWA93869.1 type VI secretion system lipoprotein TssJ [Pseudomonas gingeri]NWB03341.1 type VI secretion system lipoprotein TssJ [Pseudomonas gingeri]